MPLGSCVHGPDGLSGLRVRSPRPRAAASLMLIIYTYLCWPAPGRRPPEDYLIMIDSF